MTSLANHASNSFVKLLLIGDAKSGKTGSLVSLVKAGYKLRILDLDNLLDILKYKVLEECPQALDAVEFRSIRDKLKAGPAGMLIDGRPQAWIKAIKMCDGWKYDDGDGETDLGKPATWPQDCILVIDSLSRLCDAAYDYHEANAPIGKSGEYDGRAVYGDAQDAVEKFLAMLTSPTFTCNTIVIAHGQYMDMPDGKKIFPQGVGQKLSPKIPQYFPNVIRYTNRAGKRTIQLKSDAMIDLANTNPSQLHEPLPIETGLATFFAALREAPSAPTQESAPVKHIKPITLNRIK